MNKSLIQFEKGYLDSISEVAKTLRETYNAIDNNYKFDLDKTEISLAIIERLKTYYNTQNNIKVLLDKSYLAAASDFFVESVLFFLKLYLKQNLSNLTARSEKEILIRTYIKNGKKRREVIRPDILIYEEDKIVAIIECKTQLGRNRKKWEEDFIEKEKKILKVFPNSKAYLLIMTGENWKPGIRDHKLKGKKYFCLLDDIWPTAFTNSSQVLTSVEDLFKLLKL